MTFHIAHEGNRILLSGDLRIGEADQLWQALLQETAQSSGDLQFDLSEVLTADGGVLALIVELRTVLSARGVKAELVGATARVETAICLYSGHASVSQRTQHKSEGIVSQLGRATLEVMAEAGSLVQFVGSMLAASIAVIRNPRSGHWKDIAPLCERAGPNALPIVILINFLVGFVMAFQSAKQLKLYGANVYVADLVGISVTRELAPLMTAIIVCGRSGAAFAAEIGSMKVNEEVDALRTLGLDPFGWLVIPRVLSLIIVMPILTLVADAVGIAGGLVVGVLDLGVTSSGYFIETITAVKGWDVGSGLLKGLVFAAAIGLVACQQGLAAVGGAESVGRRTTSAVVFSLFALVVIDAGATVLFRISNL